jgi:hypothetical protein
MKNKLIVLCVALFALLISCQAPLNDLPASSEKGQYFQYTEQLEDSVDISTNESSESSSSNEPESTTMTESDFSIITSTIFESIEQLIAFNKNPSLLNTGDQSETNYLLNLHREGTILSRDYIYIPVVPNVSDYYQEGFYYLYYIQQTPMQISFVYRLSTAATEIEASDSEIHITIMWFTRDNTENLEKQSGAKKDENGYIFDATDHDLIHQLEETCFMSVRAPFYRADYDFLQLFCNVKKVNVNPNTVTE